MCLQMKRNVDMDENAANCPYLRSEVYTELLLVMSCGDFIIDLIHGPSHRTGLLTWKNFLSPNSGILSKRHLQTAFSSTCFVN